jgi:tetratricopeptide (TPR) repeat protein
MHQQRRLTEALKFWQKAIALAPQLRGVYTGLGRTYLSIFDFEAAEAVFLEQQRQNFDPEALWYLAALAAPRDLAIARDYLQDIFLTIPPDPPAQVKESPSPPPIPEEDGVKAELLARRDYLLAALKPFSMQSSQAEVAKATGIALAQAQMWPLAIHALTIANEAKPSDAETLAFLGYASAQAGRPALGIFEQARQADPKSALPLYFQGLYLRQKGALRVAEDLFSEAITLDPKNAAIYAELAETLADQGNLGEAEIIYQEALKVAEDDPRFQLLLATFYANRGYRIVEAGLPLVEMITEQDKNNAQAYELLGQMQFVSGAPDNGEAALRRALELNPNLIGARYYLARLLERNGQIASAKVEYQRVIDWDTSGIFRDRALKDVQRLQ